MLFLYKPYQPVSLTIHYSTTQRLSFYTAPFLCDLFCFQFQIITRCTVCKESFHHNIFCISRVVDILLRPDRSQLSLPFRIEDLYAGINYFVFCFQHHQSAAVAVTLSSRREDVPLSHLTVHKRPCEYCTRDDDHNY